MSTISTAKKCRTEKLSPEGGFGYLVGVGLAIPFAAGLGSIPSFGLMFNDFLISLGQETSAVAMIASVYFCTLSFTGLFTHSLFKRFSMRSIGLFGWISYSHL